MLRRPRGLAGRSRGLQVQNGVAEPDEAGQSAYLSDAENATGAFHLYERVGMRPVMGWVIHEKSFGG